MKNYTEYVMVTDWEEVEPNDFFLTDDGWAKNVNPDSLEQAKELQVKSGLFLAYIVPAVHYVIYGQMDASQIFIDEDANEIMSCESEIIGNKHQDAFEYSY